ncbi:helix-turn-helix domain-containing protein [Lacibacter sp. H407]|uniref:helix-turn-helix domain-containing protein n=1 Tax=Lacibacter sp. H407 TaxID=3133423 RepID=UPI0030C2E358
MKNTKTITLSREERKMLRAIKSRMRKAPAADYAIYKLGIETGMNRMKLHQGFYFLFGIHIHEYLVEQRLALVKKLLRKTTLSVKAISIQSGFKNRKYFFRFFKQKTSFTPIGYRKHCKQRAS